MGMTALGCCVELLVFVFFARREADHDLVAIASALRQPVEYWGEKQFSGWDLRFVQDDERRLIFLSLLLVVVFFFFHLCNQCLGI